MERNTIVSVTTLYIMIDNTLSYNNRVSVTLILSYPMHQCGNKILLYTKTVFFTVARVHVHADVDCLSLHLPQKSAAMGMPKQIALLRKVFLFEPFPHPPEVVNLLCILPL